MRFENVDGYGAKRTQNLEQITRLVMTEQGITKASNMVCDGNKSYECFECSPSIGMI